MFLYTSIDTRRSASFHRTSAFWQNRVLSLEGQRGVIFEISLVTPSATARRLSNVTNARTHTRNPKSIKMHSSTHFFVCGPSERKMLDRNWSDRTHRGIGSSTRARAQRLRWHAPASHRPKNQFSRMSNERADEATLVA